MDIMVLMGTFGELMVFLLGEWILIGFGEGVYGEEKGLVFMFI